MKAYIKKNWWKYLIALGVIFLDMLTKFLIVPADESLWKSTSLIGDFLWITPSKNIGAGFSILSGKVWLLILVTVIFLVGLTIYQFMFPKKSKIYNIALSLIFAGAIGNLIDRIFFGYVRDFLYFKFINFPVFNVADMALTFGVIILIVYILFFAKKEGETKSQQEVQVKKNDLTKNQDTANFGGANERKSRNRLTAKTDAMKDSTNDINKRQEQLAKIDAQNERLTNSKTDGSAGK